MTNTKKILIGKVYANWCGHCISLKPEWKRMKSHIKNNYKNIKFIEAESSQIDKVENLKRKYNIIPEGYPTLFKIKENGEVEYYKGPRQSNDLIHWATGSNMNKYMGGTKGTRKKNRTKSRSYKKPSGTRKR